MAAPSSRGSRSRGLRSATPRSWATTAVGHPCRLRRSAPCPLADGIANTARGARRFIDEVVARVRRAEATGELVMRFDSGFWSDDTLVGLARLDVRYTMAVRTNTKGTAAVAGIDEDDWVEINYTPGGQAQVAECHYKGRRLVIRRTRLTDAHQAKLWPDWRHFGFLTDLDGPHRDHRRLPPAARGR